MDEVFKDKRFAHISKDPRFRQMRREEHKVKIDRRFHGMFQDKQFKLKYTVDKRGRPLHTTTNENLKKYYELSSSEAEDSSDEGEDSTEESADEDDEVETEQHGQLKDAEVETEILGKGKPTKIQMKHSSKDSTDSVPKKIKSKSAVDIEKKVKQSKSQLQQKELKLGKESKSKVLDRQGKHKLAVVEGSDAESSEDPGQVGTDSSDSGSGSSDESQDEEIPVSRDPGVGHSDGPDYARGEGIIESSSDEEEDEEEESDDGEFDHGWGELDKAAPEVETATRRFAVCNMDWDRIKARDLLVLFNSFKPTGGVIFSVSIYPSEFGEKRMKQEELKGPTELVEPGPGSHTLTDEGAEGDKYHRERLRQYQLNRLKYYYAVVDCDSANTANHIYEQCDGLEYESSASKLDLRFIPEDMTFDQEAKNVAKEMPDVTTYKPTLFANTALQQSKVDLTWDETDKDRVAMTMRKFNKDEIEEMDVKAYLASDSEPEQDPYGDLVDEEGIGGTSDEEDETEEKQIEKYRLLLLGGKASEESGSKDQEKNMEMEITWEPGLKETTEDLVKEKAKKAHSLTPWEEYMEKKKEKKMKKKEEKAKKSKAKKSEVDSDDDLPAGVDLSDPYFREEIEAMDSETSKQGPSGKKKSGQKKQKRKHKDDADSAETKVEQDELSLLLLDEDDNKQHFSLKAIMDREQAAGKKKKKLRKKKKLEKDDVPVAEDTFKIDVQDSRFAAVYEDPLYNLDPSAPEFKKTQAMEALAAEKQQRRQRNRNKPETGKRRAQHVGESAYISVKKVRSVDNSSEKGQKTDAALANLVKSVKAKTQTLQEKRKNTKKYSGPPTKRRV